jgi:hypothetical protein
VSQLVNCVGEPDARNGHVRFDEREQETEPDQTGLRRRGESPANSHRETTATAPVLDSTMGVRNDVSSGALLVDEGNLPLHGQAP